MSPCEDFFPDAVELPLEDVLDLHSFPPKEIKLLVKDYLEDAYNAGFAEARIIHGKGVGIVRSAAAHNPHVEAVLQAPQGAGSWGSTIIRFVKGTPKVRDKQQ